MEFHDTDPNKKAPERGHINKKSDFLFPCSTPFSLVLCNSIIEVDSDNHATKAL